jgi:hypothetical protein
LSRRTSFLTHITSRNKTQYTFSIKPDGAVNNLLDVSIDEYFGIGSARMGSQAGAPSMGNPLCTLVLVLPEAPKIASLPWYAFDLKPESQGIEEAKVAHWAIVSCGP